MTQDSFRRSYLTLPIFGALAVAAGVATFTANRKARISSMQLCLADTGTGAGNTTVALKVNGVAISPAGGLSIAGAAAGKSASADITNGSNRYPGGALIQKGDVVTVDVTAVPATNKPAGGAVILDLVQVDA